MRFVGAALALRQSRCKQRSYKTFPRAGDFALRQSRCKQRSYKQRSYKTFLRAGDGHFSDQQRPAANSTAQVLIIADHLNALI